jgi:hypothetical protein
VIEVVRRRLDARERHRWSEALARRPIASARPPAARGPQAVATACAAVYVAIVFVIAAGRAATAIGVGVIGALASGGAALVALAGAAAWRQYRSAWREGRFLFPWGYVEVEADRARYVPAAELDCAIEGDTLIVRGADVDTTFDASEPRVRAALASLGAPHPARVDEGYRDGPRAIAGAVIRGARVSPVTRMVAALLAAALAGAVAADLVPSVAPARSHAHASDGPAPTARMPSRVPAANR